MRKGKRVSLRIDWATHEAAKYACMNWHYSKRIPVNKLVKLGVWENDNFIGVVIFGTGANRNLFKPYGIGSLEGCELVRIALSEHQAPVSKIIKIALKFLKKSNPGLKLVVSYADPLQCHHGGVYQAGGWIYAGRSQPQSDVIINGRPVHKRVASMKFGTIKGLKKTPPKWKHTYLMPLDNEIRAKLSALSKPYPKRASSKDSVATGVQSVEGGAIPTDALHSRGGGVING